MATEEQLLYNSSIAHLALLNANLRIGQRLTITNRIVSNLSFYLKRVGSPGGTITFTIRKVSDDSILASKLLGNANDISTAITLYEVTFNSPVFVNEEVRILSEATGGTTDNVIEVSNQDTDVKASEYTTRYSNSWINHTGEDIAYIYTYTATAGAPTVTTQATTTITATTATGHGTIVSIGGAPVTQHGHCWDVTANPTTTDSGSGQWGRTTKGAGGTDTFQSNITGLSASTLYHTRAYATNLYGTAYGADITFTTTATGVPVLSTQSCINVSFTTATGRGTIISIGGSAVTQHGVCWALTINPTIADSKTTDGAAGVGAFTSSMTGMTQGTTYYIRAYATNTQGTGYGDNEVVVLLTNKYKVTTPTTGGIDWGGLGGILASTPAFVDIFSDMIKLNIKRGRMHELGRVEAGTAVITLTNSTGNYWRNNTTSPFYPNVTPLKRVRIPVTYNGIDYNLFDGVTESFQPGWIETRGGKSPVMTIQCVDLFKSFNRFALVGSSSGATLYSAELSGTRINNILDTIDFPATMRSVNAGKVFVAPLIPPDGGTNTMEHLQDIAKAEGGVIYMRGDGFIVFEDKLDRQVSPHNTSQATFASSSQPYALPEFIDDDTWIYNEARIISSASTPVEQVYANTTSIAAIGERAYVETDSKVLLDSEAYDKAYLTVKKYTDSALRCQSLLLLPDASPSTLYPATFGYDLSTRVTLQLNNTENPANINSGYHIEGIEHDYDAKTNFWQTKWQLWDVNKYWAFEAGIQTCHASYIINSNEVSYANCQSAATGSTTQNDTPLFVIGQTASTGTYWSVLRGLFSFDTSGLGASATITTADLIVFSDFAQTPYEAFNLTITSPGNVVYPVAVSDFGTLGSQTSSWGIVAVTSTAKAQNEPLIINLNSTGVTNINKTGVTYFGIRSSKDISATAPSLSPSVEDLGMWGVDSPSSGIFPPRLIVHLV